MIGFDWQDDLPRRAVLPSAVALCFEAGLAADLKVIVYRGAMETDSIPPKKVPLAVIRSLFSHQEASALVAEIWESRDALSDGSRSRLRAAIRSGLRIGGFRDSSMAPTALLAENACAILRNSRCVSAVLGALVERRSEEFRCVREFLGEKSSNAEVLHGFPEEVFVSLPPARVGQFARDFVTHRGDVPDYVARALIFAAVLNDTDSNVPAKPTALGMPWQEFLERLHDIDPGSPVWEEVETFIARVNELREQIELQRKAILQKENLRALMARCASEVAGEFRDEISYVGIDLESLTGTLAGCGDEQRLLALFDELRVNLQGLRTVRAQPAATLAQDEARQASLREAGQRISGTVHAIEHLIAAAGSDGSGTAGGEAAVAVALDAVESGISEWISVDVSSDPDDGVESVASEPATCEESDEGREEPAVPEVAEPSPTKLATLPASFAEAPALPLAPPDPGCAGSATATPADAPVVDIEGTDEDLPGEPAPGESSVRPDVVHDSLDGLRPIGVTPERLRDWRTRGCEEEMESLARLQRAWLIDGRLLPAQLVAAFLEEGGVFSFSAQVPEVIPEWQCGFAIAMRNDRAATLEPVWGELIQRAYDMQNWSEERERFFSVWLAVGLLGGRSERCLALCESLRSGFVWLNGSPLDQFLRDALLTPASRGMMPELHSGVSDADLRRQFKAELDRAMERMQAKANFNNDAIKKFWYRLVGIGGPVQEVIELARKGEFPGEYLSADAVARRVDGWDGIVSRYRGNILHRLENLVAHLEAARQLNESIRKRNSVDLASIRREDAIAAVEGADLRIEQLCTARCPSTSGYREVVRRLSHLLSSSGGVP